MKQVYLSLGGNIGQPLFCLKEAISLLSSRKDVVFSLKTSHFYRTSPVKVATSHEFVNAACSFWTSLSAIEVFKMTQAIETQLGKIPKPKNVARPIDIDLLFYGDETCEDPKLIIPHPHWKERLFVLIPLADLTEEVFFSNKNGAEQRYRLQDLIQDLLTVENGQKILLLEKNKEKNDL